MEVVSRKEKKKKTRVLEMTEVQCELGNKSKRKMPGSHGTQIQNIWWIPSDLLKAMINLIKRLLYMCVF